MVTIVKNKTWKIIKAIIISVVVVAFLAGLYLADYWNLIPKKYYTAEDFGIKTLISTADFNGNGIDDTTDLLFGARQDAQNKPKYDGRYWSEGYPPDHIGVCTDVVWRAFKRAGYSLRRMVDVDISHNPAQYPGVGEGRDTNIDFRRVVNLKVFFERNAISLTTNPEEIEQWQPGDIVTYYPHHIAIVSDKRNREGMPYIIHNEGQPVREEDALTRYEISGHFRFDASLLDKTFILLFEY